MHKIGQPGGLLGKFLALLLKPGFHLMKNVLKPLAKIVLIPLESTAAAPATAPAIHKKMFRSAITKPIILYQNFSCQYREIKD